MFNLSSRAIDQTALYVANMNIYNRKRDEEKKASDKLAAYQVTMAAVDKICVLGLPVERLNIKQLEALLVPLKRKEDGTVPTQKVDALVKVVGCERWS